MRATTLKWAVFGAVIAWVFSYPWLVDPAAQTFGPIIGVRFGPTTLPCATNPLADCSSPNKDANLKIFQGNGPEWGFVDKYGAVVHQGFRNVLSFAGNVGWGYVRSGRLVDGLCPEDFGGPNVRPCVKAQTDASGWALLDAAGRVRRPATIMSADSADPAMLSDVYPFSEGLAAVDFGFLGSSRYAYVDETGRVVIPGPYEDAGPFTDGLAPVELKGGGWWIFIDRNGLQNGDVYAEAGRYSQGYAPVLLKEGWTYADRTGRLIGTGVFFAAVRQFRDGLGPTRLGGDLEHRGNHVPEEGGLWGYVNQSGTVVIPHRYSVARSFREGLASVCTGEKATYRCGAIDATGATRIPFTYTLSLSPFYEGLAIARNGLKAFFVDKEGRRFRRTGTGEILEFDDARVFVNGIAAVRVGELWGFIDHDGLFTAQPMFLEVARDWPEGRGDNDDNLWPHGWLVED